MRVEALNSMVHIEQNAIVLFQGDSITDCGRDYGDPGSLGQGYALMLPPGLEWNSRQSDCNS